MILKLRSRVMDSIVRLVRYNMKIVFANKFIYFLLVALILFLLVTTVNLLSTETTFDFSDVYILLLLPGLLMIFYPTTFAIQSDADTRLLESLFGIPNYRYKIYLIRIVMAEMLSMTILAFFGLIIYLTLTPFPFASMMIQLFFPLLSIGCMAFMFATWLRNGTAAAVVMGIIGLFFFFFQDWLKDSRWNLFHNPFREFSDMNALIWADTTFYNRVILLVCALVALLMGLRNLQKREWFVS